MKSHFTKARFVGKLPSGQRVHRVPVIVRHNDSRLCATVLERRFEVLAESATAAATWARNRVDTIPETEVIAFGPKGGRVERFIGWETAIFMRMSNNCGRQLSLF